MDGAAMTNGTAIHAFELDDVHMGSAAHLSSVTIPAAFALAETYGKSGSEFLTAVVVGYEVGARVGIAAGPSHGQRGYHITGTVGTLAASASAARMLGLHASACTDALGLGATQAAGLHSAHTGAMSKRFHAGRAAQSGVVAALLAQRGFTGSATALEQSFGGFFSTLCESADAQAACAQLGTRWETQDIGFKVHASCALTHTTVDALDRLIKRGVSPANLSHLRIAMARKAFATVARRYVPSGVVTAQMNGYFTAAVKLLDGTAFIDQFTESRLADPAILQLIEKITIVHDPALDAGGTAKRHAVHLTADLADGATVVEAVEQRRGSARYPLSREEIEAKFRRLTHGILSPEAVDQLMKLIDELDHLASVKPLADLLRQT
jgi:2-methylcitrate dehydratase PrpD